MNLEKSGALIAELRRAKGLTQKDVAAALGVLPKTVSKWECGNGFPDVSCLSALAETLGVSTSALLDGQITRNSAQTGNIKRMKFYVCLTCGSMLTSMGEAEIICCGTRLSPLKPAPCDEHHAPNVDTADDETYITFDHEMEKEHYISFVTAVGFDRALTVKLYPEQDCAVRLPRIPRARLFFYCNKHGLFEMRI